MQSGSSQALKMTFSYFEKMVTKSKYLVVPHVYIAGGQKREFQEPSDAPQNQNGMATAFRENRCFSLTSGRFNW